MAIAIVVCDGEWYVCCCCCVLSCSLSCTRTNSEFLSSVLAQDVQGIQVQVYSGTEVTVCPLKTMGSGTFQVLSYSMCELYGTAFSVNR